MAQKDYIVDPGTATVTFKGATVATYDVETKKVKEYENDGARRKRWIAGALKEAPDADPNQNFDIESEDAYETAIAIAEGEADFYSVFPSAPRPSFNPVGHLHEDIFNWVKEHFEPVLPYMYPNGYWSAKHAGMGANRTIRPIEDIKIDYLN